MPLTKTAPPSIAVSHTSKELDLDQFERELANKEKVLLQIVASLERAKTVRRRTLESEFSI